jgi:hypothetical protein
MYSTLCASVRAICQPEQNIRTDYCLVQKQIPVKRSTIGVMIEVFFFCFFVF